MNILQKTVHQSIYPDLVKRPQPFSPPDKERKLRKSYLVAACRNFALEGFNLGINGHVTVRDPEYHDRFWVNPIDISMRMLKSSDLVCVDSEGSVFSNNRPVTPSAIWIHSEIYKRHDNLNAIIHLHSLYGRSFSALHLPIMPTSVESCIFYEDHALYSNYWALALNRDEGRREGIELSKTLGNNKLLIESNHGLITVGETVSAATFRFLAAESVCQEQLLLHSTGNYVKMTHEAALQTHHQIGSEYMCWLNYEQKFQEMFFMYPEIEE